MNSLYTLYQTKPNSAIITTGQVLRLKSTFPKFNNTFVKQQRRFPPPRQQASPFSFRMQTHSVPYSKSSRLIKLLIALIFRMKQFNFQKCYVSFCSEGFLSSSAPGRRRRTKLSVRRLLSYRNRFS